MPLDEVYKASILAARTLIEKEPDYTFVTARLLHDLPGSHRPGSAPPSAAAYADNFLFIKKGVTASCSTRG